MILTEDQLIDLIIYSFTAWFSYVLFSGSQNFRLLYIERMGHVTYRRITKCFEHLCLFSFFYLITVLSSYTGMIYYVGDCLLVGFIVRQFLLSDRLHRGEYLRRYTESRRKSLNQMIVNLGHEPTFHDN